MPIHILACPKFLVPRFLPFLDFLGLKKDSLGLHHQNEQSESELLRWSVVQAVCILCLRVFCEWSVLEQIFFLASLIPVLKAAMRPTCACETFVAKLFWRMGPLVYESVLFLRLISFYNELNLKFFINDNIFLTPKTTKVKLSKAKSLLMNL